ncbi:MAG: hypothetical protein ACXVDJ_05240 [Tumebacillaceae bacterium]
MREKSVQIYQYLAEEQLVDAMNAIPPREKERIEGLADWIERQLELFAALLLQQVLAKELGLPFEGLVWELDRERQTVRVPEADWQGYVLIDSRRKFISVTVDEKQSFNRVSGSHVPYLFTVEFEKAWMTEEETAFCNQLSETKQKWFKDRLWACKATSLHLLGIDDPNRAEEFSFDVNLWEELQFRSTNAIGAHGKLSFYLGSFRVLWTSIPFEEVHREHIELHQLMKWPKKTRYLARFKKAFRALVGKRLVERGFFYHDSITLVRTTDEDLVHILHFHKNRKGDMQFLISFAARPLFVPQSGESLSLEPGGRLMNELESELGSNTWWNCHTQELMEQSFQRAFDKIEQVLLPLFDRVSSAEAMLEEVEGKGTLLQIASQNHSYFERAFLCMKIGDWDRAKSNFERFYEIASMKSSPHDLLMIEWMHEALSKIEQGQEAVDAHLKAIAAQRRQALKFPAVE